MNLWANDTIIATRAIRPCARTLELLLIVKTRTCLLFYLSLRAGLLMCSSPVSQKRKPKTPGTGLIIRALAVPDVKLHSVRYRFLVVCRTTVITG